MERISAEREECWSKEVQHMNKQPELLIEIIAAAAVLAVVIAIIAMTAVGGKGYI